MKTGFQLGSALILLHFALITACEQKVNLPTDLVAEPSTVVSTSTTISGVVDWCNAGDILGPRSLHASATWSNYLYVIGGRDSNAIPAGEVFFAERFSDGSLSNWKLTTNMPVPTSHLEAIAYNDYLYYFGGYDYVTGYNNVYRSKINFDGTIDPWEELNPLPYLVSNYAVELHNNRVYIFGGAELSLTQGNNVYYNAVQKADFNPDGTLTPWSEVSQLPIAVLQHSSTMWGDYVYIIGGTTTLVNTGIDELYTPTSQVIYSTIAADGSLGVWNQTINFPGAVLFHSSFAFEGKIYVVGGIESSPTAVYYSYINLDGSLSGWLRANDLPKTKMIHSNILIDDFIYIIGGSDQEVIYGQYIKDDFWGVFCPN